MAMSNDKKTASALFGAILFVAATSIIYLYATGPSDEGVAFVLRWSGRIAFLILIIAFAARPLQQVIRAPWTAKLLRNRRLFGVAFAGIHIAHFGLILLRTRLSEDFSFEYNHFGAVIYGTILAMLVTSFSAPARAIGPRAWKVLHKVGLYILVVGFTVSQLPRAGIPVDPANVVLLVLAGAALLARIAAFVRRRQPRPQ